MATLLHLCGLQTDHGRVNETTFRHRIMFPTHITGRIELAAATPERVDSIAERFVSELARVRASDVMRQGNTITFKGGVFRLVSSWNILGPVSQGAIELKVGPPPEIAYRFSCIQMLVITTLMVIVMGLFVATSPRAPLALKLGAPVIMWLWLFGMNYLIAAYRLPAFVRRTAGA